MKLCDLSRLVLRNILYFWPKNMWLLAIIALATALVTGALILGSSVRHSLAEAAFARTGQVDAALTAQNRWMSDELCERVEGEAMPLIQVEAFCYDADGLPLKVNLLGVENDFFGFVYGQRQSLMHEGRPQAMLSPESLQKLGLREGENVVLRLPQSSHFAEGLSWSLNDKEMLGLRLPLRVAQACTGFALNSGMQEGINVFVPKSYLAEELEKEGRANLLLVKGSAALRQPACLQDYGLSLAPLPQGGWELSSTQTFIPEAVGTVLADWAEPQERIFSYFVNEVKGSAGSTPYSFISGATTPLGEPLSGAECSITQWLADDLQAKVGDRLDLRFFELQAQGQLSEGEAQLIVKDIIPTADRRALSPAFPGFTDSDSCNDWDPSVPIDMEAIRDKDESYWDAYQASPKLFVSLEKAQELFGSAQGQLSAIRFAASWDEAQLRTRLEQALAERITLFQTLPLKALNEQGTSQAMDFSGLFFALSFFVIVAALILLVIICGQRLEAKRYELALLQSLGYGRRHLRGLLLGELGFYALLGTGLGCLLSLGYVAGILYLLNSIWNSVSGYATINFYAGPQELLLGAGLSLGICLLSIIWLTRSFLKSKLKDHLRKDFSQRMWTRRDQAMLLLWGGLSLASYLYNALCKGNADVALFFTSSFLLLLLSFKLSKYLLYRWQCASAEASLSLTGLALRNVTRQLSRSMGLLSMFSLGMYICLLTMLNHRSMEDEQHPQSGTGGYYGILETVVPIRHDLNSEEGRRAYHLEDLPPALQVQQVKVIEGAQAGCLNLNRVVRPQLLAAPMAALEGRFRFADEEAHWGLLQGDSSSRIIPVVADAEVIQWSLGLKIGDELDYQAEGGELYRLKFVAALDKSIFQGYVLVSPENLARMYPHMGASQLLLLGFDAKAYLPCISRALERQGVFFSTAAGRLNLFNDVQNTYLMIFFVLGTIGLMMASLGYMLMMAQQLQQRQHELAVLRCAGYGAREMRRLILVENSIILVLSLAASLFALAGAALPLLLQGLISPPYGVMLSSLALMVGTAFLLLLALSRAWSHGQLLPRLRQD